MMKASVNNSMTREVRLQSHSAQMLPHKNNTKTLEKVTMLTLVHV